MKIFDTVEFGIVYLQKQYLEKITVDYQLK